MPTLRALRTIARRELTHIAADRWTVVAITLVPLLVGIILVAIYSERTVQDLPTVVIDQDRTVASRALARALDSHETLRLVRIEPGLQDPEDIIRRGNASCVLVIPRGFEASLKRGEHTPLLCLLNGSNMVLSNYALKAVSSTVTTAAAGIAIDKIEMRGTPAPHAVAAYAPLAVNARFLFNPGQNYANFFVPGILAALLQQIVVIGAVLAWVREFRSGDIRELLGITTSLPVLVTGKLLVYVLIGSIWAVLLFGGLFALSGVPYTGSYAAGVITVVLMIAGMALLAMFISSMFTHRETAMQVVFIISSPAFLVSGYTFPQCAMTGVIRWIGYIVPLTPFLTAWRRLVLYGGGFTDVLPQLGIMTVAIVAYAVLMAAVLKRRCRGFQGGSYEHVQ